MNKYKKTIALDFDGVIHKYSMGWQDGKIYDPPMNGAIQAINSLIKHYKIFIFTARDPSQVVPWLVRNFKITCILLSDNEKFCPDNNDGKILFVTNKKLPANIYIDDRGYMFNNWKQTMQDLSKLI